VSIPTDENRDLLTVVATITARPDKVQEVKDLLGAIIEPTRKEDGNITYALHQSTDDPTVFVFYEVWTSRAALDTHLGSPGLQEGLAALGALVAAPPVIVPLHRIG